MNDEALAQRADFIGSRLTRHLVEIGIDVEPYDLDQWATLGLPLLDRASGWTDIVARERPEGAGDMAMVFRFCPAVMARTTASLPVLPDGTGEIRNVATYCDLVEHVADLEATRWDDVADDVNRRNQAEEDLYTVHPGALVFISLVQAAALDRA